jgi:hypothetical protein
MFIWDKLNEITQSFYFLFPAGFVDRNIITLNHRQSVTLSFDSDLSDDREMKPFTDRDRLSSRWSNEVIERDIFRNRSSRFPQRSLEYEMIPVNGNQQNSPFRWSPDLHVDSSNRIPSLS